MTTGCDPNEPTSRLTADAAEGAAAPEAGKPSVGSAARPGPVRMDEEARRRLGRNLRLLYASLLDQPLPERLTTLVDELAATTADREGSR